MTTLQRTAHLQCSPFGRPPLRPGLV